MMYAIIKNLILKAQNNRLPYFTASISLIHLKYEL